jgi:hypothetical protein
MRLAVCIGVPGKDVRQLKTWSLCRCRVRVRGNRHGELPQCRQFRGLRKPQDIQWTLGVFQPFLGDVQIPSRRLEAAMPHQGLNGGKIDSRFEQVRGKAVTQGVDSMPMDDTGTFLELVIDTRRGPP